MKQKMEKEENKKNRFRLICSTAIVAITLALIVGLSYAWFFNRSNIATLVAIAPPSPIAIKGANGQDLQSLDLSYGSDEKVGDTVTIHRVISVKSSGAHRLEIVHTTNLKELTFTLYPATESAKASTTGAQVSENVGGTTYSYTYNQSEPVAGHYINLSTTLSTDAGYKYADGTNKGSNYGNLNNVQTHVEPVYWISNNSLSADTQNPVNSVTNSTNNTNSTSDDPTSDSGTSSTNEYLTYYVLEISWTEDDKETDIFYVMAQGE